MKEAHIDFLNFNSIIIILLIILVGGYLYYEIYKMKLSMNDIHNKINALIDNTRNITLDNIVEKNELSPPEMIHSESKIKQPLNIQKENFQDIHSIQEQMNKNDSSDSHSESSYDSRSDSSDSSDSESRISQSEIEKDYGKDKFEQENNNASIDDIISDKHIITDNSLSDILNVDNDLTNIDDYMNSIKKQNEDKIIKKEYKDMTVSELKKILVEMKLPVSGNKTKLIERIKENKN
tara:strand:+ start:410 stop:1117 length:708 start_codon:yes stop_codon:yes gene_type:complete